MKHPDFKSMKKEELQECCLSEEADRNIKLLYWLDFFLNDKENNLYQAVSVAPNEKDKTELKMQLNSTKNLVDVTKKRQEDVKIMTQSFLGRFRMEAEKILPIDLYREVDRKARETA